jgi:hypothetical protein
VPEHTFNQPLPIGARIVWEQDGEEQFQTVALEWTGRDLYVPVTDARYPAVDRLGAGHLPHGPRLPEKRNGRLRVDT